jgi:putative peptidoglycan lipid II flippase
MLLSPILFGVSGMVTGILNARQHFAAPALAPMVYNAAIVLGAIFLSEPYGVHGLAIAVVIGAAGHLLVQLPALRAVGMRWRPIFGLASEGVREVARLMGPRIIGLAAAQVNFIVVIFFASFVSDAAISAVNYAFLMAMLPVGVVGMAISTAVFPTLARQGAAQQLQALRTSVASSLRLILFLAIPAAVGLMALAEPAVRLLLERGEFDAADTGLVASTLLFYGIGVPAIAAIEILSRGFYALSDTRTPVQVAVLAMLLNVVLCAALVAPLGVRGLAAAGSLAALAECAWLWWLLHERLGDLEPRQMRASVARTLAASTVMGEVILLLMLLLHGAGLEGGTAFGALAVAVLSGGGGALAFVATASLIGSQEYRMLVGRLGG